MRTGDRTPWGTADDVEQLGPEVWSVSTASHGGVRISGAALKAIPAEVRRTWLNAGGWAEEDCEMGIALALLESKGHVDRTRLWLEVERLRQLALETARRYDRYAAAVAHLERLTAATPEATTVPPGGGNHRRAPEGSRAAWRPARKDQAASGRARLRPRKRRGCARDAGARQRRGTGVGLPPAAVDRNVAATATSARRSRRKSTPDTGPEGRPATRAPPPANQHPPRDHAREGGRSRAGEQQPPRPRHNGPEGNGSAPRPNPPERPPSETPGTRPNGRAGRHRTKTALDAETATLRPKRAQTADAGRHTGNGRRRPKNEARHAPGGPKARPRAKALKRTTE